ncbi:MAG TPA: efflux RND transporter periplasmic adaptor subunit [Polyangiaceae bacterium]|nr:efflux RND transporter periplasmic adaptor subunit [Polyangiaceae bacterium]
MTSRSEPVVVPPSAKAALPHERSAANDEIGFALPEPAKVSGTRVAFVLLGVVLVLGVLFAVGYLPKVQARTALVQATVAEQTAAPRVAVVAPKEGSSSHSITLPGNVKALEETTIYSRANGFVKEWDVDIGDKVKAGQRLALIETPDLDQEILQASAQLAQAEASVKQATATRDLAKSSLDRYKKLSAEGLATKQELDERSAQADVDVANVEVANATVRTQRANLARLGQLKSFATVTAPFAGTITARMIDRGALVVSGNSAPLFKLAALDPVRVFVDVPQDAAPGVSAGLDVAVSVREFPGRVFKGTVSRTAGALDPASRTLSTEIRVPNPDGQLLTGMYAEAALTLPTPHRTYELPATAVLTNAKGVGVQIVQPDGAVHLTPVVIEQDLGATVRISSGLQGGEQVLKLSTPGLADGTKVEIAR